MSAIKQLGVGSQEKRDRKQEKRGQEAGILRCWEPVKYRNILLNFAISMGQKKKEDGFKKRYRVKQYGKLIRKGMGAGPQFRPAPLSWVLLILHSRLKCFGFLSKALKHSLIGEIYCHKMFNLILRRTLCTVNMKASWFHTFHWIFAFVNRQCLLFKFRVD